MDLDQIQHFYLDLTAQLHHLLLHPHLPLQQVVALSIALHQAAIALWHSVAQTLQQLVALSLALHQASIAQLHSIAQYPVAHSIARYPVAAAARQILQLQSTIMVLNLVMIKHQVEDKNKPAWLMLPRKVDW